MHVSDTDFMNSVAGVAQLAERRTLDPVVASSSLALGSCYLFFFDITHYDFIHKSTSQMVISRHILVG